MHLRETDRVVNVIHYNKDRHRKHGIPFRFVLCEVRFESRMPWTGSFLIP